MLGSKKPTRKVVPESGFPSVNLEKKPAPRFRSSSDDLFPRTLCPSLSVPEPKPRRHTTEKTTLDLRLDRVRRQTTGLWQTEIEEREDEAMSPVQKNATLIPLPRILESCECVFLSKRPAMTQSKVVLLQYRGVLGTGPPLLQRVYYRPELLEGLKRLRTRFQVAVFAQAEDPVSDVKELVGNCVDALYVSRRADYIGTGKTVRMENYGKVLADFECQAEGLLVRLI